MNITLLLQSFAGLVALLALLMFFLLYSFKSKKVVSKTPSKTEEQDISLTTLRKKLRNNKTTGKELVQTLDLILKHYGKIHPKIGTKTHPDFDNYTEILYTIARHQNANKNIILNFDKELQKHNPEYKKEINNALMKGLNSRKS